MFFTNLKKYRFVRRPNRFVMELEGPREGRVFAHTPNTGTMATLLEGKPWVWVSEHDNPKRKYHFSTELLEWEDGGERQFCLINTHRSADVVSEGIREGRVPHLSAKEIQREVQYGERGKSRVDILVRDREGREHFIEVKNATLLVEPGVVAFPDAVTARGQKHLQELAREAKLGNGAIVFFLVARTDGRAFQVAEEIDPNFAGAFREARGGGGGGDHPPPPPQPHLWPLSPFRSRSRATVPNVPLSRGRTKFCQSIGLTC